MPESIIEFRSVAYRIGERTILQNVNLLVAEGETVVLLGRSGSGKTTLLRMVNALVEPTEGEVRYNGQPIRELDPIKLRRKIGYVIQEAGLFPHLTVGANVGIVPKLEHWPSERIAERVSTLLRTVDLDPAEFADRYPRELSGGQRQRVGIARALAADPPLLLLDEPFGALDPITRFELQRQFLALRDEMGKTALFVTHDVREALLLGTRVAILREGTLDFLGTPEEFRRSDAPEALAFRSSLEQQVSA